VTRSFDAGVPFFIWAEVPRWIESPIPAEIRSFEDLERFVPRATEAAGLDAERPLPFLVTAHQDFIEFHILNRIGDPPHNMEMRKKIQIKLELAKAEATIVGFHSTRHRAAISTSMTRDNSQSGHIQKIEIGSEATLCLPAA
jgi:acetolactate decarboxylase